MKTVWKWIILVLLLGYLCFMAVWARGEADRHSCRGINITIRGTGLADTITRNGLMGALRKYPEKIVGMPLNRINTLGIEKYIMGLNNFEDVRCYMTAQGYLTVSIQPMVPEIRVFSNGKSFYVNKDGKQMSSNAEFFVDVPVVTGKFTPKFTPKDVLPVVRFVERDSVLKHIVAMYEVRDKDNIILIPHITGHVINFGDTSRMEEKRNAILTAYHNIIPYRGWNTYDTISVKFKGQIVASRRDKAPLYPVQTMVEEIDPEEGSLPLDDAPGMVAENESTVAGQNQN